MNTYKVEFSYIGKDGNRVHETDICTAWHSWDAARDIYEYYCDYCPELRIEHVWIETNNAWELREFEL